jgi:hypothetical protein
MTVLEFCSIRGIQTQRVLKYIQRNPENFEGHTSKNGQYMEIDDDAFAILDKKYPIPSEVIPSPSAELMAELDRAKNMIIQLQADAIVHEKLLAKAELDKLLLEERNLQLLEARTTCTELQGQAADLHQQIGSLEAQLKASREETIKMREEASRASQEAERLRSRSLWQRIINA